MNFLPTWQEAVKIAIVVIVTMALVTRVPVLSQLVGGGTTE